MTMTLTPPETRERTAPSLRTRSLPKAAVGALHGLAVLLAVAWIVGPADARAGLLAVVLAGIVPLWSRIVEGRRKAKDRLVTLLVTTAFGIALIPLGSIVWTVLEKGVPVLSREFFTYSMRNVVGEGGGIHHAITGTLLITLGATVISVPIGLFTAIYVVEYGDGTRLAGALRFLVDVMTGIPSIVAGLFAFALWAVLFGVGTKNGFSGAVALSVLMIPTVVRSAEEMLRIVPNELREAALALGVPKWRTIVRVVLPTAASGLAAGVTLAIARVVGETAPLLVAVGVTQGINVNPGDGPMNTLAVYAYNLFKYPRNPGYPDPSLDRAWAAAFLLILVVVLLNLSARLIARFFAPKTTG